MSVLWFGSYHSTSALFSSVEAHTTFIPVYKVLYSPHSHPTALNRIISNSAFSHSSFKRMHKTRMPWSEWWVTWTPIMMVRWTSLSSSSWWAHSQWPAMTSSLTVHHPRTSLSQSQMRRMERIKSNEGMRMGAWERNVSGCFCSQEWRSEKKPVCFELLITWNFQLLCLSLLITLP